VGNATDRVTIASGADFSLGVRKDGTLWSWGWNESGQLGLSDTKPIIQQKNEPTQIRPRLIDKNSELAWDGPLGPQIDQPPFK
jgi:alpha-tubulin suppressor-like RCC1 family protein